MMKRGEVRWYRFSQPGKRRPIVILTRDSALDFLGEITIAPITSIIRTIPSEVPLAESDGMPQECVVNLDHVQTVSKGKIGSLVTTLTPRKMAELRSALLFALGFPE
jgi:mRNA interferase MazF